MPILTTPFKAIAKIEPKPASFYYPGIEDSTELTIVPTATETWAVEGLSLKFSAKYRIKSLVNVEAAGKALEKQEEALEAQEKEITKAKTALASQLLQLESVAKIRGEEYTKKPESNPLAVAEEADAAVSATKKEQAGLEGELQATKRTIETVRMEFTLLGRQAAKESSEKSSLVILVRLYARSNELIYDSIISPVRSLTFHGYEPPEGITTYADTKVTEIVNTHVEFNNPIMIAERENLKLTLQFIGPSAPFKEVLGEEGTIIFADEVVGEKELSEIASNINYSRTVT